MAKVLLALGSNLGEREKNLEQALAASAELPGTQLLARSPLVETVPVGGPAGQGAYLNAAALASTVLSPQELLQKLLGIEAELGRVRNRRWDSRRIDLDILLYDDLVLAAPEMSIPHPRLVQRRFVLEPAAKIAPWMIHPPSGWTVARLLDQLDGGADFVAVAAVDSAAAERLARQTARRLNLPFRPGVADSTNAPGDLCVRSWAPEMDEARRRPKLILAQASSGSDEGRCRTILKLPAAGPVVWLPCEESAAAEEAVAAVQSAWPVLAAIEPA